MTALVCLARDLAEATRSIDWDASKVDGLVRQILTVRSDASVDELDASLSVLAERVAASRPDDGDGVAHVAITGGSLIEAGAPPHALAEALLHKLPPVLTAARAFANECLREIADPENAEVDDPHPIAEVDGIVISRTLFRAKLTNDRAGGCALAYLQSWALPAVAAWTRDRGVLARAVGDTDLVAAAAAMRESEAYFVDCLLGTELEASWLVALPLLGRAFDVRVDGIVRNWDAHALLADALDAYGVPAFRNDRDVLDALRSEHGAQQDASVRGTWNMYSYRASRFDLARGADVPLDAWVWGEGAPRDVPTFGGRRALLLGPPSVERQWSAGRVFSKLLASVRVERELPRDEVRHILAAMREHGDP